MKSSASSTGDTRKWYVNILVDEVRREVVVTSIRPIGTFGPTDSTDPTDRRPAYTYLLHARDELEAFQFLIRAAQKWKHYKLKGAD